ncbi:DUF368 domain-containing protein [Parvibaculum sp.]|uniref:DUF368 domain-containing protein n=1 Tax=Parvibaculum sp. TaxID=2024848 RepID=UPI00272F3CCE|nr:DUF368 domain-containing protein [Parvibaculum sp.]MDP1628584.1 DUF368 domain-containing protein [Parvibaculum sp.]MDP2150080.1 DUF368 domain-containing protein [Parvibaculum sp.]MDP3330080.1 DUF368 domain-containing protein [Parvibaculum sp.]
MAPNKNLSDFPLSKEWQWKPLLGWTAAALLLVASWLFQPTRGYWDIFDVAVFRAINGTVARDERIAVFWALTGGRQFGPFLLVTILAVYFYFIGRADLARFRHGAAFAVLTAILVLAAVVLQELVAYSRPSPSLALDSYHSIKALVPWSMAGEGSASSSADNWMTATIVLAVLWWRGFTWRLGLAGAALALLCVLPPIAAGAHWPTDALIGGGAIAILALALTSGTPVAWWIYRAALRPTDWTISHWQRFVAELSPEGHDNPNPTRQVLRGMCVGAADLVPGVSGGTMALILGIYKRLIGAIAHIDKEMLNLLMRRQFLAAARHIDFMFVLPLGIGVVLSLIIFSRIVPLSLLVAEFPEVTFGFFFGLIAASIVGLLSHVDIRGPGSWAWIALGICFGLFAAILVPVKTPDAAWFIFLCGMVAVAAMLVPGISGSFVLLILGKYTDAIDALGRLDLGFLLPLGTGVVVGALTFSRAISWLLDRFYQKTLLTVIGVLGGSLLAVWPFKDREYEIIGEKARLVAAHPYVPMNVDLTVALGIAAIFAGAFLYRLLDRLAQHAEENGTAAG